MRWGHIALAVIAFGGCSRNRTPAEPMLEVKTGDTKVSGSVMIGQPLTLIADWSGSCERYSMGDSKEPLKGSWSSGTCNQVTSFDLEVKCSLPCEVGRQRSDVNFTVLRDVIPQQAGKLELEIFYRSPFHHDRRVTYAVTVHAPKSVVLLGCGNQKEIPLDALLLAPPGQALDTAPSVPMWQPPPGPAAQTPRIHCTKVDLEAEGSLRVQAVTTSDKKLFVPIGVNGSPAMELSMHGLEALFDPVIADGLYPIRLFVMGKPIDLMIDVRGRMQRAEP